MNVQNVPSEEQIAAVLGLDTSSRRRVWLKRAIWLGILTAVIAAGLWWYLQIGGSAATITYQTTPAARTDLIIEVQATGTIQPTTQVDVSSEMSGVIRTVSVDNNSLVQKGEVLAQLDTVKLTAQLARSRALLAASEARLLEAKATREERRLALERAEALHKKGVSAIQDLDTARANFARAEASVTAAEADINVAKAEVALVETDISKTSILSPVNGIVLEAQRGAWPDRGIFASGAHSLHAGRRPRAHAGGGRHRRSRHRRREARSGGDLHRRRLPGPEASPRRYRPSNTRRQRRRMSLPTRRSSPSTTRTCCSGPA